MLQDRQTCRQQSLCPKEPAEEARHRQTVRWGSQGNARTELQRAMDSERTQHTWKIDQEDRLEEAVYQ